MKTSIIILHLLFVTISLAQKKPINFKSEIDFGRGIVFSTFFDVAIAHDQFTITSPRNADVRIMGGKAKLGRILGKSPKKGIIITIHGKQETDSLFGDTKIPMVGKLKFKGTVNNNILSGEFIDDDAVTVGTLHGVSSDEKSIDYSYLYPIIVKTIEENIYSRSALQNKEWKKFENEIESLCENAQDDIEMFIGFNILAKKLPFTHLTLSISKDQLDSEESSSAYRSVLFEEKNNSTAYLKIKNFSSSKDELAAILPTIVENAAYKNLIIDLRDNGGGGIEPAFELAKHIVTDGIEVGYFVTNKLQYSGYQPELFRTLPGLQPKSTIEFTNDLKTSSGAKLFFKKPDGPVFTGKIYVLTNGNTGSTCEPIVYSLKKSKRATIIGERTAGAMLAAVPFNVAGKYIILLPIADFFTHDGVRLDKVGVSPDIEVRSEDALEKALELINNDAVN